MAFSGTCGSFTFLWNQIEPNQQCNKYQLFHWLELNKMYYESVCIWTKDFAVVDLGSGCIWSCGCLIAHCYWDWKQVCNPFSRPSRSSRAGCVVIQNGTQLVGLCPCLANFDIVEYTSGMLCPRCIQVQLSQEYSRIMSESLSELRL